MEWKDAKKYEMPVDEFILVGLFVYCAKEKYFEQYVAKVNSDDGMMEDTNDNDIGWTKDDIEYWIPLPEPPTD